MLLLILSSTCLVLGLPPPSSIDWMPRPDSELMSEYQVPADLLHQIKISQFCNSMIKDLYCNPSDPSGLIPEAHRTGVLSKLREAYAALKATLHIKISRKWHGILIHIYGCQLTLHSCCTPSPTCCRCSFERLHVFPPRITYPTWRVPVPLQRYM